MDKYENLTVEFELLNADGTKYDPPKNPLKDKWNKLYPPTRNGKPCDPVLGSADRYGRPIYNYSCVLCYEPKCPHSHGWVVPEEDKEEIERYEQEYIEYVSAHNPSYAKMYEKLSER